MVDPRWWFTKAICEPIHLELEKSVSFMSLITKDLKIKIRIQGGDDYFY